MCNLVSLESVGYEVPARYASGNVQLASEHKAWSLEMDGRNQHRATKRKNQRAGQDLGGLEEGEQALSQLRGHGR